MKFQRFLTQLSKTNATLNNFVDFDKVINNINEIAIKLNQLNYLVGKNNLKEAIKELFEENKNCFSVLNIIIAVRDNRLVIDSEGGIAPLNSYFQSYERVYEYMKETGLAKVLKNKNINNLVDYAFGIEVGLDSNARKNRAGKNMHQMVKSIFEKNKIEFDKRSKNVKIPQLSNIGGFDFVIETKKKTYLIKANYYNMAGSKLNEIAGAYIELASKINQYKELEFVWITDGQGWYYAKKKLEEAFNNIQKLYNLTSIKSFITLIKREL